MIELLVVAFVAGILTVLAPCILPLLPVVVGGSGLHDTSARVSLKRPIVTVLSLVVSIIIFTLLLKSTTLLLGIPATIWNSISGGIIILFGINLLFPAVWENIMIKTGLQARSNRLLAASQTKTAIKKDILLGAALGPVFNSCSPTYALIVAIILPASFGVGLGYLASYALGLGAILLLVSVFGRILVAKMKWMSNPNGWFQKLIGVIFVIVGVLILFGIDKKIQAFVLEQGWYDPISSIEKALH